MEEKDKYKETKVIESETAVVRVYRPELTEDERKKRVAQIHKATEALFRTVAIRERRKGKCSSPMTR